MIFGASLRSSSTCSAVANVSGGIFLSGEAQRYWQDKGFKVEVRAEHGPIGIFQVRSNLLNALPKCG